MYATVSWPRKAFRRVTMAYVATRGRRQIVRIAVEYSVIVGQRRVVESAVGAQSIEFTVIAYTMCPSSQRIELTPVNVRYTDLGEELYVRIGLNH